MARQRRQAERPDAIPGFSPKRPGAERLAATRFVDGVATAAVDSVAAEVAVALVYNGATHAVMMASPADLVDFARGFTLSEGIVDDVAEIGTVEVRDMVFGLQVDIAVPERAATALAGRRRNGSSGTACGLCGVLSLEDAMRPLPVRRSDLAVPAAAIQRGFAELPALQVLNRRTGGLHAAAVADADGRVVLAREDVGRHNALDKVIGAAAAAGLDPARHVLLLTSRCSTEMVQKAAVAGFPVVAAISAPTSLAVELADRAGVTLVAFARGANLTAYTHATRIQGR